MSSIGFEGESLQFTTRLVFDRVGDRTFLSESRSELPLQVQRPMLRPDGSAVVTLLTPAGALLDGDDIAIQVECRAGADVTLRQTGATRLHPCRGRGIQLDVTVHVAAEATFRYLPFELIPYAGANYLQRTTLHLEDGAAAWVTEVVSPGRLNEPFEYERLDLCTDAYVDGERLVRDHQVIEPRRTNCRAMLAGHTHFATLLGFGPDATPERANYVHETLANAGVMGSASVLSRYGIGARAIGDAADPLLRTLRAAVP
jgi:urease accessory protein